MKYVKFDLYWRKPENRKYFDEFYQIKRDAPEKVKKLFSLSKTNRGRKTKNTQ